MGKKRHSVEQIIRILRQAEVFSSQGKKVDEFCRELGISDATFYNWRKAYGGLQIDQAKRLKELEAENTRLKRAVAELTLNNQILKDVSEGNF